VLSISVVLGALGFTLPKTWLSRRIKARQEKIINALPDMLDLLMVCVESGMSFDSALTRVAEQPEGRRSPLHQEVLRLNLEIRAGRPRHEALRALANRCGVRDVSAMVSVFIQTDRLGTSISSALRVYAENARVKRRHRAEERAYLAPVKMIFPMILFLMPAFMLVAMGPALLGLLASLRAMGAR
jgi:tight adherence protein C